MGAFFIFAANCTVRAAGDSEIRLAMFIGAQIIFHHRLYY